MKKWGLLLFGAAFSLAVRPAAGQARTARVRELVHQIRQKNELQGQHVGYAGITPAQYRRFEALRDSAGEAVLRRLVRHPNGVVSAYAGWALADRGYPQLAALFRYYARPHRRITAQHGCIVGRNSLVNEFYARVSRHRFYPARGTDSAFYARQLAQIDSLILYRYPRRGLLRSALAHNAANPRHYEVVRALYLRGHDAHALRALAAYRRPADVPLIRAAGRAALAAVAEFPDPAFWPQLTSFDLQAYAGESNYLGSLYLADYYRALASYRDARSAAFMRELIRQPQLPQPYQLAEALTATRAPVYDELLLELWTSHKILLPAAVDRLGAARPAAAAQAFAQGLLSATPYPPPAAGYWATDTVVTRLLRHLERYDPAALPAVCSHNVLTAEFTPLESVLSYVRRHRLAACKPALLTRLQGTNSAFDTFHLAQTALAFADPALTREISRLLAAQQAQWNWGNWPANFQKLLSAHGISLPPMPPAKP